jgi:3-oxoadipyl-CoA thiolase
MTARAYIVDGVRTPIGRYAGALAPVRPDDMAAHVMKELMARHPTIESGEIDEVVMGCANQAGEDNRNVARMALLIAGLPETVPGITVNRLCASGADAVVAGARMIRSGEADLVIAGGIESMSRAPFVIPKADVAFSRHTEIHDTTLGWRFVNPAIKNFYGIDSMGETAENVAQEFNISREDQDCYALRSQERTAKAQSNGRLSEEIVPVTVQKGRSEPVLVDKDEHPRTVTLENLARLKPAFRPGGSVTAGNSSGINDGAAALLLASEQALERYGLSPLATITTAASAGVAPRVMGLGPIPATRKLLERTELTISQIDIVELNEAFASQVLAVLRELGLPEDAEHVNPNGGAIALGHPLGMSGARLILTASLELDHRGASTALVTMCVGVGQGVAVLLEKP